MARQPRFFVPGGVLHVIQRGNNRDPIFVTERDYCFFIDCLGRAIREHEVWLHSYVLMTNHVHLLATPQNVASLPKTLQSVGRRYVQHFNGAHQRSGTLWEGRYRATLVDSEQYLLTCMRYIELNPVRAGMVGRPARYLWSSYRANAQGARDLLVTSHEVYKRLGHSSSERQRAYRELFHDRISEPVLEAIREATNKNWALGSDKFKQRIEALSGRRSDRIRLGRPARICGAGSRV